MQFMSKAVGATIARKALMVEKHSPSLLFGAGVGGMVVSTVLACKATLKVEEVLDEGKRKMDQAKTLEHREYSERDRQRDYQIITVQTAVKVARLYAPAVIVGGASIAALAQSHNILNKRNAALAAAYAGLEKGFNEYRQRVIEKYGEEEDRNLRYGAKQVEVVDEDTGKKKKVMRVDPDLVPSIYARFFDPLSPSWSREPEYNLIFLKAQQNYANDLLHARGHVFLNEVYDMLGIPRSKAGSVVGWVLTSDGVNNYIDFGIFQGDSYSVRDFVNGQEGAILLDFNVDGVIYDKLDEPGETIAWQG
jgi:Family of unknown function (DUF6353)